MVSEFLKNLRQMGWTQEEIAEKVGIRQNLISKLMKGGECKVSTLKKIADAFQVSADYVLSRGPVRKTGDNHHYDGLERRRNSLMKKA